MKNLRKDNRITFSETRTKVCLLLSFFLPVLILLVIAFKFKIYPFSSDCVITEPMQKTYLPVISELRRKIFAGESLFYSWNVGGGSNFWAWIGAYAASPFALLYLLFPADRIAEATQIIFALKAAVAALCLFVLFWKKENVVSPVSVGLSVAYGLSAYVLTYSQEPWILDTVILLPLLILTLWNLILGKRKWMFTLMCALAGITCCHAGVYMLLFVIIMFPLLYIEARHEELKLAKLSDISFHILTHYTYTYNTDVSAKVVTDTFDDGVIMPSIKGMKSPKKGEMNDYRDEDRLNPLSREDRGTITREVEQKVKVKGVNKVNTQPSAQNLKPIDGVNRAGVNVKANPTVQGAGVNAKVNPATQGASKGANTQATPAVKPKTEYIQRRPKTTNKTLNLNQTKYEEITKPTYMDYELEIIELKF